MNGWKEQPSGAGWYWIIAKNDESKEATLAEVVANSADNMYVRIQQAEGVFQSRVVDQYLFQGPLQAPDASESQLEALLARTYPTATLTVSKNCVSERWSVLIDLGTKKIFGEANRVVFDISAEKRDVARAYAITLLTNDLLIGLLTQE